MLSKKAVSFGTGFKAGLKAGEMGDVVAAGRQAARAQKFAEAAAGGPSIDVGAALGTGRPAALAANKLELLSTELTKRGVDGNTIQQIVNDGFSKGLTVDQILVGQGIKYDPAVFIAGQGMTGTAAEQVAARETVLQSGTPRPGGSGIALEKIDGIDVAGTQLPGAPTITEEGGFIVETYPDGRKVRTLKGYDPKPLGEAVGTATEAATTTTRAAPLDIQVEPSCLETGQVKTPGVMDSLRKLGPRRGRFW